MIQVAKDVCGSAMECEVGMWSYKKVWAKICTKFMVRLVGVKKE